MAPKKSGGRAITPQQLVPPPPPEMALQKSANIFPSYPTQAGAQVPQMDISGFRPTAVPNYNMAPVDALKNVDVSGLRSARDTSLSTLKSMQDASEAGTGIPDLAMPQQSEFEQYMQNGLANRFVTALQGENNYGSRFSRGFDMGQKIAANVVVPAIGAFGGGPGAVGALAATESLKQHSKESEQLRAANKHQLNTTLANLAQLYENISPSSAKNASTHLAQAIQIAQLKRAATQDQTRDLLSAQSQNLAAEKALTDATQGGNKDYAGAYNGAFGNLLSGAKVVQDDNQFTAKQGLEGVKIGQAQQGIALDARKVDLEGQKMTAKNANDAIVNTREGTKVKDAAMLGLDRIVRLNLNNALATDPATGRAKYTNMAHYLQANPLMAPVIQNMAEHAGITGMSPEQIMQMFPPDAPAAAPGGGGFDPGAMIGGAANAISSGAGKMLFGGQSQAPAVTFADIQKAPEQHIKLGVDAFKDSGATVNSIIQQLTAAGVKPTAEQLKAIYDQLESKNGTRSKGR